MIQTPACDASFICKEIKCMYSFYIALVYLRKSSALCASECAGTYFGIIIGIIHFLCGTEPINCTIETNVGQFCV